VVLSAALVSALPITPGGLGAVEFAIVAILDRAISYWGLMAVGAVVYMVSGKK